VLEFFILLNICDRDVTFQCTRCCLGRRRILSEMVSRAFSRVQHETCHKFGIYGHIQAKLGQYIKKHIGNRLAELSRHTVRVLMWHVSPNTPPLQKSKKCTKMHFFAVKASEHHFHDIQLSILTNSYQTMTRPYQYDDLERFMPLPKGFCCNCCRVCCNVYVLL
jgi:hypothetical protein